MVQSLLGLKIFDWNMKLGGTLMMTCDGLSRNCSYCGGHPRFVFTLQGTGWNSMPAGHMQQLLLLAVLNLAGSCELGLTSLFAALLREQTAD